MSATFAVEAFGATDVGRVRTSNQDHFVIASLRRSLRILHTSLEAAVIARRFEAPEALLFAVADGVGGRAGGELASRATVGSLLEYVGQAMGCYQRLDVEKEDELLQRLEQGIRDTHEGIIRRHGSASQAPATTLTLALLVAPRLYIVHVGDTRAYYLHDGRLRQITRDQTMGEYLVDMGALTEEQAKVAPAARTLASAIGSSELSPSIGLVDLQPGDSLLLCSDGLNRHVPDERIADVLRQPLSAEAACSALIADALAGGGRDNVTVVVARMPPV